MEEKASLRDKLTRLKNEQKSYEDYSEVPFFRKQWFFWTLLLGPIIAIFLIMLSMTSEERLNMVMKNYEGVKVITVCILSFIFIPSIWTAWGILIFDNVYYWKQGKIRVFNKTSKIILYISAGCVLWFFYH